MSDHIPKEVWQKWPNAIAVLTAARTWVIQAEDPTKPAGDARWVWLGEGRSEEEAWADAARRCEKCESTPEA